MSKFLSLSPAQAGFLSAAVHGLLLLALAASPFLDRSDPPVVPLSLEMLVAEVAVDEVEVRLDVAVIPPVEVEPSLVEAELPDDAWMERAPIQDWDLVERWLDPQSFAAWSRGAQSLAENPPEMGLAYRSDRNSVQAAQSSRSAGVKKVRARVTLYKVPATGSVPATAGSAAQAEKKAVPWTAFCPPPDYPPLALQRRWQGVSRIWASVSAQGRVLQVRIETSSGYAVLDRAALQAVRNWRFKPAKVEGKSVAGTIVLPIRFQIPEWE
jgi:TonB family protein